MDMTVPVWNQARFNEIVILIGDMLESLRYSRELLQFIPVSGLAGINLISAEICSSGTSPDLFLVVSLMLFLFCLSMLLMQLKFV